MKRVIAFLLVALAVGAVEWFVFVWADELAFRLDIHEAGMLAAAYTFAVLMVSGVVGLFGGWLLRRLLA